MEKAGLITNLRRQVRFNLTVNGHKICSYVLDFQYDQGDKTIFEDFKGISTPTYRIKKKLMKAIYDIDIYETRAR